MTSEHSSSPSHPHSNNPYMAIFDGITVKSVKEVKAKVIKDAESLGLEGGFILDEISKDPNLTLEEMLDILTFESEENPLLKQLIIAIKVNLQRSKLSKIKPESSANSAENDAQMSMGSHSDSMQDLGD